MSSLSFSYSAHRVPTTAAPRPTSACARPAAVAAAKSAERISLSSPYSFFSIFFSFPFSFFFSSLSLSDLTPSFSPCTVNTHLHTYRALERIQCHSQTHCARPPRTRARTLSKSRRPRSPHPMHLHCCAHLPTSSLAHAPSWPQQRAHSRAIARLGSLLRCRAAHCRRPASPPR